MKRFATMSCMVGLFSLTPAGVFATSPHFVGRVTAAFVDTSVQVCFKEAGLGETPVVVGATADVTAVFDCVNGGGQCPDAANKHTVSGPVDQFVTVTPRNGQITVCVILAAPAAPDFCPPGQTETLSSITFANIAAEDATTEISQAATPGTLSQTPFTCPAP